MRANRSKYLFSVNTHTPPTMTVDPARSSPSRYAAPRRRRGHPARYGNTVHGGLRRASSGADSRADCRAWRQTGDVVAIDLIELTRSVSARARSCETRGASPRVPGTDGASPRRCTTAAAWFGSRRITAASQPQPRTISTMPPEGYKILCRRLRRRFRPKGRGQGAGLPAGPGRGCARLFWRSPRPDQRRHHHRTGIECSMNLRARVTLLKDRVLEAHRSSARAGQCISSVLVRMSRKQPKTPRPAVDFAVARPASAGKRLTCC